HSTLMLLKWVNHTKQPQYQRLTRARPPQPSLRRRRRQSAQHNRRNHHFNAVVELSIRKQRNWKLTRSGGTKEQKGVPENREKNQGRRADQVRHQAANIRLRKSGGQHRQALFKKAQIVGG